MIASAKRHMIPALSELWQVCFGDSQAYISRFMQHRFVPEQTVVWLEDSAPVGVAYLLPCTIGTHNAIYGYAVGVLPEYRRHGVAAAILSVAESACSSRGMPLLVAPREGLTEYYRRRGYREAFFCRWAEFSGIGTVRPLTLKEARSECCRRLRDRDLPHEGLVRWDGSAVQYALLEHRECGGFAHILHWDGAEYLLLGHREGGWLVLDETTLPEALLSWLSPSLCAHYNAVNLRCLLPAGQGDGKAAGMCREPITWSAGWLGLDLT